MGGADKEYRGDKRDIRNWVVLELTASGEQKAEDGTLASLIRSSIGAPADFPVFVPTAVYHNHGKRVVVHLMEGYAFVASGLSETNYLKLERNNAYIRKVLTQRGYANMRALSVVPDASIQDMRAQLLTHLSSDVTLGMRVIFNDGIYANLDGEVVAVDSQTACVRVVMRSLDVITEVSRLSVSPVSEGAEDTSL